MIYSIGYQKLELARLVKLVNHFHATLIDCRSSPRSRKKGFGRASLEAALGEYYLWKGDVLGGKTRRPSAKGLAWLVDKDLSAGEFENLMLLCMEEAPGECHRHRLIALPLAEKFGVVVLHIFQNEIVTATDLQAAIDTDGEYDCYELPV